MDANKLVTCIRFGHKTGLDGNCRRCGAGSGTVLELGNALAVWVDKINDQADEIERLQAEVLYLRQMAQGLAHEEWGETLEPLFAKRLMAAANGVRCDTCKGTGRTLWGDSAMGSGIGGQTMTYGPCPGTNRSAANSNCPVWLAESDGA